MAATRRELLAGLGAGLVAMQGGALAADGEAIAAARRQWATVGDIERLEREIRDVNQRMQNALSRVRRSGFAPGALHYEDSITDSDSFPSALTTTGGASTEHAIAFPGSVVAISVVADSAYSGVAASNYIEFEVYVNGIASGFLARIEGGSRVGYALQSKGNDELAVGDLLQLKAVNHTGTPVGGGIPHSAEVWVSFT